jgi:hypothetical protein
MKAADGNYYAVYGSNMGDRRRYYSLSEREWQEGKHIREVRCHNCSHRFPAMTPGINVCPSCMASNNLS